MNESIEVAGVGPVHQDKPIRIPIRPGFVVLTGDIGEGKSETLDAVLALTTGEGSLSVNRDSGAGHVRGAGVEIKVGRTTRRSGELRVKSLRGVNPMDVVDPGIKDPVAADAERIRVLSKLVGATLSHAQFAALVGGDAVLREVVSYKTFAIEGAPEMAAAFEREFHAAKRRYEDEAKTQEGTAEGLRESNKDVDLTSESDDTTLAASTEAALRRLHTAEGERKEADARRAKTTAARARLEDAARARGGISSEEARSRLEIAQADKATKADEVAGSEILVAKARRELELAVQRLDLAKERHTGAARAADAAQALVAQAIESERSLEDARALVGADQGSAGPSDDDLANMRRSVEAARKRQNNGAVVREALKRARDSEAAAEKAKALRARAEVFKEAAAGCDELLSSAIQKLAPAGLKIRAGRLVGPNHHGELVNFDELSDGERLRIVLPIAIAAVGDGGLMVMPQRNFQDLSPKVRVEIERILVEHDATIITAVVGTGPLRVEAA